MSNGFLDPQIELREVRGRSYEQTKTLVLPKLYDVGVQRVAALAGVDRIGLPVHAVYRPSSISVSLSMGKGVTPAASIVSALMECYEVSVAERFFPDRRRCFIGANPNKFDPKCDIHNGILRTFISDTSRSIKNIPQSEWCRARDFDRDESLWVPASCIHMRILTEQPQIWVRSTNGLASGNTVEEALLHAVTEVVERDAVTVFISKNIALQLQSLVHPGSFGERITSLTEAIEKKSICVRLFDITTDVNVPVIVCLLIDQDPSCPRHLQMVFGAGCSLDRTLASGRAITEAAQSRVALIQSTREDFNQKLLLRFSNLHQENQWKHMKNIFTQATATESTKKYEMNPTTLDVSDVPRDANSRLQIIRNRLKDAADSNEPGFGKIYWVELTESGCNLPVVKAFVTGLEHPHDDSNFMPTSRLKRLYIQ